MKRIIGFLFVCLFIVVSQIGAEAQNIETRPTLKSPEYEYCDGENLTAKKEDRICFHYFADEVEIVVGNSSNSPRPQRADELPSVRSLINKGRVESYEFFSDKFIRERNFSPEMVEKIENSNLPNILQLKFKNIQNDEDFLEILKEIKKDEFVKEVRMVSEMKALGHTNDPQSVKQYYFDKVKFKEAQEIVGYGSPDIHIMFPDSGYDASHEDLPQPYGYFNHLTNIKEIPQDKFGHGTATAGIVAQIPNNRVGGIGVSPGVSIWVRKVLGDNGFGEWSSAAQAFLDQTNECIRMRKENPNVRCIFSISMGGLGPIPVIDATLDIALAEGIVVVAAAGNAPIDLARIPLYPAAKKGVIAVAASNQNDELTDWSAYSSELLVTMAPGTDILVAVPKQIGPGKFIDLNGYVYGSGTSFSAPQVAGAIALLWTRYRDLTADQIRFLTVGSADIIPGAQPYIASGGRLNAETMVNVPFGEIPLPPKKFSISNSSHIAIKTRQSFSDGIVGYVHFISNEPFDEESSQRKNVRQIMTFDPSLRTKIGKTTETTIGNLSEETAWFLRIKSVHITGSLSEFSDMIEVATKKSEVHVLRTFTNESGGPDTGQWYVEAHGAQLIPIWHLSDVMRSSSEKKQLLWRYGRKEELDYRVGGAHAMVVSEMFDLRGKNGASLKFDYFQNMTTIIPGADEFQVWAMPFSDNLLDNRDTSVLLKNYKNSPNSKSFSTTEELLDLTAVAGKRFRLGFRVFIRSGGQYGGIGWMFGNVRIYTDETSYLY